MVAHFGLRYDIHSNKQTRNSTTSVAFKTCSHQRGWNRERQGGKTEKEEANCKVREKAKQAIFETKHVAKNSTHNCLTEVTTHEFQLPLLTVVIC